MQLAKFHCSGRLLWRDDTIKTPFGMGAGASLRNKLEKGPSAVNSSPTLQKWLKLSKPDIHICFVGVKGFYWYCIADSFGWENMSRKAAPKPEELIQKLEEKFNGFKVRREKLKEMEFCKGRWICDYDRRRLSRSGRVNVQAKRSFRFASSQVPQPTCESGLGVQYPKKWEILK